jgi:hypothetical protein
MMGGLAGTFMGAAQVAWYPDPIVNTPKGMIEKKISWQAIGRTILRPAVWMALA